ncbi:MAG: ABC transporter permease subunit [Oligoflexia bacterium]|nr:ABC transporter permease subunit [Oligoflexia bacterium]
MSHRAETKIPSALDTAGAVAKVTFFEIMRDKVLYNVLICGIFLIVLGLLASRLSYIRPERILLDFGHSAIALSCALIAIFLGSGLIGREFERRTIHMALSRPVLRSHFVFGKFLGICAVITANWLLFLVAYLGILFLMRAEWQVSPIHGALFWSVVFALLQSFVLASLAIFFSTFSTTSLSVIFTVGTYLVGVNISRLHAVVSKLGTGGGLRSLDFAISLLPNLEHFDLGLHLTYGVPVSGASVLLAFAYAAAVCGVFLLLAGVLIRSKDV